MANMTNMENIVIDDMVSLALTNATDLHNDDNSNDNIVTCTATKVKLYRLTDGNGHQLFNTCGICEGCGNPFHLSYLYVPQGVEEESWPVFYEGRYCKDCWSKG